MVWAAGGFWGQVKAFLAVLYQFVLTLGGPGLFFLALADSSFLSIPEGNDLLIVILSTGATWQTMVYYVLMTTSGSVVGCTLLYLVGRRGGRFAERRLSAGRMERMQRLYARWGSLAIIVPSILPPPTPFKVFVLSAGLFGLPLVKFLTAVAVGRSIRYFSWGVLALLYGERAKAFLEQNMHTVGVVLLIVFVLLIVGLWVLQSRRRSKPEETPA